MACALAAILAAAASPWAEAAPAAPRPLPSRAVVDSLRLELSRNDAFTQMAATAESLLARAPLTGAADSVLVADLLDLLVEAKIRAEDVASLPLDTLCDRSLAIRLHTSGEQSRAYATTLHLRGHVARKLGKGDECRVLYERSLAIRRAVLGDQDADVGQVLCSLATATSGIDMEAANRLIAQSVAIRRAALPPDHPDLATSLHNQGFILGWIGDYDGAERAYQEALAIRRRSLVPGHYETVRTLVSLGALFLDRREPLRAVECLREAIRLGTARGRPQALAESNLITALMQLNDLPGALAVADRVVARLRAAGNTGEDPILMSMRALRRKAQVERRMNKSAAARQTVATGRALLDSVTAGRQPSPAEAVVLADFAVEQRELGDVTGAMESLQRAIAALEAAHLPPESPDLLQMRMQLANTLARAGDWRTAEVVFADIVPGVTRTLGNDHLLRSDALLGLARAQWVLGNRVDAMEAAIESERIARLFRQLVIRGLPHGPALQFTDIPSTSLDVALNLASAPHVHAEWVARACDAVIRSRAVVLDELCQRQRQTCSSTDPAVAAASEELRATCRRLSDEGLLALNRGGLTRRRQVRDRAIAEKDSLERFLAARGSDCAAPGVQAAGLAEVQAALPDSAVLVGYIRFREISPGLETQKPVYGAFVVGRNMPVAFVRLGAAADIETAVENWRREASRMPRRRSSAPGGEAERTYWEAATRLHEMIWEPVARLAGLPAQVIVVPDGGLRGVNFLALPAGDGKYWAEAGPDLRILLAERDLVHGVSASAARRSAFIVGGPEFDAPAHRPGGVREDPGGLSVVAAVRAGPDSCATVTAKFGALPGARREALEVARILRAAGTAPADVQCCVGRSATAGAFRQAAGRYTCLHLATHAFAASGPCWRGLDSIGVRDPERGAAWRANPLMGCGLAFAGANQGAASGGIMTGEEVAALDLTHVATVVLSACETGFGTIDHADGVLDLSRAFQMAGVQDVVATLWPIDDEASIEWMRGFYSAQCVGRAPTAAARDASRAFLVKQRRESRSTHPALWAPFVVMTR